MGGRRNRLRSRRCWQTEGQRMPTQRAYGLRILRSHAAQIPSQVCREKQIDCDEQAEAQVEASVRIFPSPDLEVDTVHGVPNTLAFRRGWLELQDCNRVSCGEENQQDR